MEEIIIIIWQGFSSTVCYSSTDVDYSPLLLLPKTHHAVTRAVRSHSGLWISRKAAVWVQLKLNICTEVTPLMTK